MVWRFKRKVMLAMKSNGNYPIDGSVVVDAERVFRVLPKRLSKYGLTLHPDKTRLIDIGDQDKDNRF